MSVKTSGNKFPIDSLLVLRASGQAAITSTGTSDSSLGLDVLTAYWNTGDLAEILDMAVEVIVESIDTSSGDETYKFDVEVATTSNFSSPVSVADATVTATGRTTLVIDRTRIANAIGSSATAGYLRVKATLGGTTPSLGWNAYVAPLPGL